MKLLLKKKITLLIACFLLASMRLIAQQSIPNGNFENWSERSIWAPIGYETSDLEQSDRGIIGTAERVSDAQNGQYAIRLTSKKFTSSGDVSPGYFANLSGDGGNEDPSKWHGGMPINEKPTGIKGYYKSDVKAGDSAFILLVFSKNGQNIGTYTFMFGGAKSTYTQFDFTLSPALPATPDSMIFAAVSSNVFQQIAIEGSMLQLDNITLSGVTNQPTQFNGNFENWYEVKPKTLDNWRVKTRYQGDLRTTDKYKGNFAIKLVSTLDKDGSLSKIEDTNISTGYYTQTGNEGGFPFTNMVDTISFWYKYTTPGTSKAAMYYTFKKAGNIIGGQRVELEPWNNGYKNMIIPINAEFGGPPDTIIVSFESSRGDVDKYELTNEGATLFLDEVQLSSQKLKTSISKLWIISQIKVFPNPTKDELNIYIPEKIWNGESTLTIYNQLGQEVLVQNLSNEDSKVSLNTLLPGIYNYTVNNDSQNPKTGKLIIQ